MKVSVFNSIMKKMESLMALPYTPLEEDAVKDEEEEEESKQLDIQIGDREYRRAKDKKTLQMITFNQGAGSMIAVD